jgi:predicted nuclease with TOPRIM domain
MSNDDRNIHEMESKYTRLCEDIREMEKIMADKEERVRKLESRTSVLEEKFFNLSNLLDQKIGSLRESFDKSIGHLTIAINELKGFKSKLNWMLIGTLTSSGFTLLTIIIGLIVTLIKIGIL